MITPTLTVLVEIATPNYSNVRTHYRVKAKQVKEQRAAVTEALNLATWPSWFALNPPTADNPYDVLLTRVSVGTLDDDGLVSSCKAARDAVAAFVGIDDKLRRVIRYRYRQRKGKPAAVEIRIEPRQTSITDIIECEQEGAA